MKQLLLIALLFLPIAYAAQMNITQIDNTTFMVGLYTDATTDLRIVIASGDVELSEISTEGLYLEYFEDTLPYWNYTVYGYASDTISIPFEFKPLISESLPPKNDTPAPSVTPRRSGGGGRSYTPTPAPTPQVQNVTPKVLEVYHKTPKPKPVITSEPEEIVETEQKNETNTTIIEQEVEKPTNWKLIISILLALIALVMISLLIANNMKGEQY